VDIHFCNSYYEYSFIDLVNMNIHLCTMYLVNMDIHLSGNNENKLVIKCGINIINIYKVPMDKLNIFLWMKHMHLHLFHEFINKIKKKLLLKKNYKEKTVFLFV